MYGFLLLRKSRRAGHLKKLAGWSPLRFAHVAGVSVVSLQFLVSCAPAHLKHTAFLLQFAEVWLCARHRKHCTVGFGVSYFSQYIFMCSMYLVCSICDRDQLYIKNLIWIKPDKCSLSTRCNAECINSLNQTLNTE